MSATVMPVAYEDASDEVRAVYDDIMSSRNIDFIPNVWRTLASHPPTLARVWYGLKEVMAPGHGMTEEMYGELMAVIGMFNQTNKLIEGYQVEVDDFLKEV